MTEDSEIYVVNYIVDGKFLWERYCNGHCHFKMSIFVSAVLFLTIFQHIALNTIDAIYDGPDWLFIYYYRIINI